MKFAVILQTFKRTGPWLSPRGWAMLGGFIAGGMLVFTFMLKWQ
jgi:hypothetical protein